MNPLARTALFSFEVDAEGKVMEKVTKLERFNKNLGHSTSKLQELAN
jgi:hypothetical protein